MGKIYSSELHKNENAAIEFGAAIVGLVWQARAVIANLADSKKADEYAPGVIHALRKVCEGEKDCSHVYTAEVEEWRATFRAWFERIKRYFPPAHAKKFLANAENDFKIILAASEGMPEYFWRKSAEERHIQITFKNEAALDAARTMAEKKHPVQLGGALHKYLEACIDKLMGATPAAPTAESANDDEAAPPPTFAPRVIHDDGYWQIFLDDFHCFDSPEDVEQDIVVTAYDVEDAVRNYIKSNHAAIAKTVHYDSESSLFEVRTKTQAVASTLLETLFRFASDREEFAKWRVKGKAGKAKK